MMLGLKHIFTYAECSMCQCLQLAPILDDLTPYYPAEYYTHRKPDSAGFGIAPNRFRSTLAFYFAGCGLRPESRILDVGCGSGSLLDGFARAGFRNCLGIDPYLAGDSQLSTGPIIRKAGIADVEPEWDILLFNHSFEHLKDPLAGLTSVARILSPSGVCLIRMPTVPCHAWRHYGVNWVQLDPPRHVFVHSAKSLAILAAAAGLIHTDTRFDSTGFQFWGSELYRIGIPLALAVDSQFTSSQMREFEQDAKNLNLTRQGDQAAFYLRKR
jgi:SAM-dependent methyltransferase